MTKKKLYESIKSLKTREVIINEYNKSATYIVELTLNADGYYDLILDFKKHLKCTTKNGLRPGHENSGARLNGQV